MDPGLIVFAVRAFVRLGKTAVDVVNQKALDESFLMPMPDTPTESMADEVNFRFKDDERYAPLVTEGRPLRADWELFLAPDNSAEKTRATASLYAAFRALEDRDQVAGDVKRILDSEEREVYGAILIAQWGRGEGPPDPLARVVVTIADIALEYVAANPSALGIGGHGEKLVEALAQNLSELIPDDVQEGVYGPKAQFGQRLVGLFLHAGLKTVTEKPDLVFGEAHLQKLVEAALVPVRDSLPGDILRDFEWSRTADALTGPAVNIALQTIGSDPKAYLGKSLDVDTALGASVAAMLITASKRGLDGTFTQEGWIALFQSVAAVAAKRPALFLGEADRKPEVVLENVFASVADALAAAPIPFKGDFGLQIAVATLDGLNESLDDVIDRTDAWETVAGDITGQILTGLKEGLGTGGADAALQHAFSQDQWIAFVRIFATQAAKTPEMVAGDGEGLRAVVKNIGMTLKEAEPPFDTGVGIALTEMVLAGLANAAPEVFDQTDPWEIVAGKIFQQIVTGVKDGVGDGQPLDMLLTEKQWTGFVRIFAEQAVRTPEMVAGSNKKLKAMVEETAKAVAAAKPPFESGYGITLTEAVFTGLANASPRVFDQTDGWERVAGRIVAGVMNGVADGFASGDGDPLESVLNRDQFIAIGRILAEEVARTPEMVAGSEEQVKGVVQAVAGAMAADANLLLTAADWERIVIVAAEEAARNPDRLFKIDTDTGGGAVATVLIRMLLEASADGLKADRQRKTGSVLFGQVLVEAVVTTLRAAAGNVQGALANSKSVQNLARDIDRIVTDRPDAFGSKEWLRVFRHELPGVIGTGTTPVLTVESVERILEGGA